MGAAMADLTKESIAKLREELTKDLEALERVERLLAGRNGPSEPEVPVLNLQSRRRITLEPPSTPPTDIPRETFEGLGLKQLVIAGLKLTGVGGAAPRDLVAFCKHNNYPFSSDANGSASITTALSRLIEDEKVRRENGRYYWIGGNEE